MDEVDVEAAWRDSIVDGLELTEQLHRLMERELDRTELTRVQARVLLAVSATPHLTDRALAARLAMSSSHFSRSAAQLIELNLLIADDHDMDRRQRRLRLSDAGDAAAAKLMASRNAAFDNAMLALPAEARSAVRRMGAFRGTGQVITGKVTVRPALVADVLTAFDLIMRQRDSRPNNHHFPAYAAKLLKVMLDRWPPEPKLAGYVMVDDNNALIAFCLIIRGSTLDEDTSDDAEVMLVGPFVVPKHRGHKRGQLLLDRCIEAARDETYLNASTYIAVDKSDLNELLECNDFRQARQTDDVDAFGDGRKWSVFSKSLIR